MNVQLQKLNIFSGGAWKWESLGFIILAIIGSCLIAYLIYMYIKNFHRKTIEEETSNRESGPNANEVINYTKHV